MLYFKIDDFTGLSLTDCTHAFAKSKNLLRLQLSKPAQYAQVMRRNGLFQFIHFDCAQISLRRRCPDFKTEWLQQMLLHITVAGGTIDRDRKPRKLAESLLQFFKSEFQRQA